MSLFKHRPSKVKYLTPVQTLDEIHKGYIASFEEKRNSIPYKHMQMENLKKELENIDQEKNFSSDRIKKKSEIKTQIKNIGNEINKIETNCDITEYYSKTSDILLNYYNITSGAFYNVASTQERQEIQEEESIEEEYMQDEQNKAVNLEVNTEKISSTLIQLNLLSQSKRKVKKPVKKRKLNFDNVQSKNKNILTFFVADAKANVIAGIDDKFNCATAPTVMRTNRATLQNEYLMLVDKSYACDHVKLRTIKYCSECGIEKTLFQSDGAYICQGCGEIDFIIIESEKPSHKDEINEKPKYPYKKINHFKEKLNQLQSKETADISDEIFETIHNELKKRCIRAEETSPPMIREILKKYKFVDCYEHLQQIYCKISGASHIVLTREVEDKVIHMFNDMQDVFQKYMPPNRSNFLNYSYVLNKIFKILNMESHAKYFKLLKSKDKLREQDAIWSKICKDMSWKYYPSL